MIERLVKFRFSYLQEYRRKHCHIAEELNLLGDETVCVREVEINEAPVAYLVSHNSAAGCDFVIRNYDGPLWWPVNLKGPLGPERFERLASEGDHSLVSAMGVEDKYGRLTWDEFRQKTSIRDLGRSTLEDAKARLQNGASRTIFCGGQAFFKAGPPAFFRPYHEKEMVIGALGLGANDFGNDSNSAGSANGASIKIRNSRPFVVICHPQGSRST